MEFRTRPKDKVLDDLVAKLRTLPQNHPGRPHLNRMVYDLSREIESKMLEGELSLRDSHST
jgi:hypothetical protein